MKKILLSSMAALSLSACGPQPSVSTPVTDTSGNVVGQVQQQQGPGFGEQVAAAGIGSVVGNMISGGLRGGGGGHVIAAPPVVHHTTVINQTVVQQRKNVTINRPAPIRQQAFSRPSSYSRSSSSFSSRRR